MAKKVTIRQVANEAGVSVTTVSQILNNKGGRFSQETRDKVLAVKEKLHYVPDFNARNLILHSSKMLGVLIPDLGNPFFSSFVRGVQDYSRDATYMPIVFSANHDAKLETYYLGKLLEHSVDGLIIASATITAEAIDKLVKPLQVPYLLFDQNQIANLADRIEVDDYHGGYLAGQHLTQLGHQKLAMLLPKDSTVNVCERLRGFKAAIKDAGLPEQNLVEINADFSMEAGYQATQSILDSVVSAVFCADDLLAIGLYRGLDERGLKVPDDLSIIGYDDIDLDEYVNPKLTTIAQPVAEIGRESAHLLVNRLEKPDIDRQLIKFPVKLIQRESTSSKK